MFSMPLLVVNSSSFFGGFILTASHCFGSNRMKSDTSYDYFKIGHLHKAEVNLVKNFYLLVRILSFNCLSFLYWGGKGGTTT